MSRFNNQSGAIATVLLLTQKLHACIITGNYCFNKILKSLKPSYKILFSREFQWQRSSERNK